MASKKKDPQRPLAAGLTDDELRTLGDQLAAKVAQYEQKDEKRKAVAKKFREELDAIQEEMTAIAEQITTKQRPIEAMGLFDKTNGGAEAEAE